MNLLVIEDGSEYAEFAELFLRPRNMEVLAVRSGAEALRVCEEHPIDRMLIDLRFERAHDHDLLGDVAATAGRLFAGDEVRALRWLKEQQGTLVLAALRERGHEQPAVFVHDFPARRLANLRKLYGRVGAVAAFDAGAICDAFEQLEVG